MNNLKITFFFLCFIISSQKIYSQNNNEANFSTYNNFDFIPGEKTMFFDDFSNGLNLWNINEWDTWYEDQKAQVTSLSDIPGNWYYMPRKGNSQPKGLKILPEQFTIEYDLVINDSVSESEGGIINIFVKENGFDFSRFDYHFDSSPQIKLDIKPYKDYLFLNAWKEYGYTAGIDDGSKVFEVTKEQYWTPNKVHRISISRNGSHVTLYVNQDKVMDMPNALPPNEKYTFLLSNNLWLSGYFISNVRLATGLPQPSYDFKENKSYVTQNILFDVNSDKINPRSYQVIKQIAQAIKETDSKILIVGHTDSDGDAVKNMELSEKRSQSVKNMLVKEFGITGGKLETEGRGQTEPINSNDTLQDKANNRRVEFIVVE